MSVKVDSYVGEAVVVSQFSDEAHEASSARRGRVPDRVAQDDSGCAVIERSAQYRPQHGGGSPRRVFGNEGRFQTGTRYHAKSLARALQNIRDVPSLGAQTNWARSDERHHLETRANGLRCVEAGANIGCLGTRYTLHGKREPRRDDRTRKRANVVEGALSGTWKTHVRMLNPELDHQPRDGGFVIESRLNDRRRLQPVAQRLIYQADILRRWSVSLVPVERHVIVRGTLRVDELERGQPGGLRDSLHEK